MKELLKEKISFFEQLRNQSQLIKSQSSNKEDIIKLDVAIITLNTVIDELRGVLNTVNETIEKQCD